MKRKSAAASAEESGAGEYIDLVVKRVSLNNIPPTDESKAPLCACPRPGCYWFALARTERKGFWRVTICIGDEKAELTITTHQLQYFKRFRRAVLRATGIYLKQEVHKDDWVDLVNIALGFRRLRAGEVTC